MMTVSCCREAATKMALRTQTDWLTIRLSLKVSAMHDVSMYGSMHQLQEVIMPLPEVIISGVVQLQEVIMPL